MAVMGYVTASASITRSYPRLTTRTLPPHVYYTPMRGHGIEEMAAVRAEASPRRYQKTKIKATLGSRVRTA